MTSPRASHDASQDAKTTESPSPRRSPLAVAAAAFPGPTRMPPELIVFVPVNVTVAAAVLLSRNELKVLLAVTEVAAAVTSLFVPPANVET